MRLKMAILGLFLTVAPLPAGTASAQPADLPIAPATTQEYPPGVSVADGPSGQIYVDRRGLTLYGMDMRTVLRWAPDPAQYCQNECATQWEPLLAPEDAVPNIRFPGPRDDRGQAPPGMVLPQKAPDWTVIAGPQGPQWVYKGWHLVFTRRGSAPRSTEFDGAGSLTWNTLKFVPPVLEIQAPEGVAPAFVDGAYALTDSKGNLLFTGKCRKPCADWTPLAGAMASRGIGPWKVDPSGDVPQWTWKGRPVFVSPGSDPATIPDGGTVLRP